MLANSRDNGPTSLPFSNRNVKMTMNQLSSQNSKQFIRRSQRTKAFTVLKLLTTVHVFQTFGSLLDPLYFTE